MSRPSLLESKNLQPYWDVDRLRQEGLWNYDIIVEPTPGSSKACVYDHQVDLMGSYSYLGLIGHPKINEAAQRAIEQYGTGTHGVRKLAGTTALHADLDAATARFLGTEDAVTFSSGYMANITLFSAFADVNHSVIADYLVHASTIDGLTLAKTQFTRFKHNNEDSLARLLSRSDASIPAVVAMEGCYSMDGDLGNLPEIYAVAKAHGATLVIDEAHSIGAIGDTGRGICEHFGIAPQLDLILMGTFSKAFPASGGYLAGSKAFCDFIRSRGRGYIFSGALAPPTTAAALASMQVILEEPWRVSRLRELTTFWKKMLDERGIPYRGGHSPVVPVMTFESERSWHIANDCIENGLFVQSIMSPVVPPGTARLRTSVNLNLDENALERAADVIQSALAKFPRESEA